MYCQKYWRWVQHVCSEFWTWWKKEVFVTLHSRQKLNCTKQNFQVGDVVLVWDDLMRYKWPMTRVIATYPDKEWIVWSVRNIQDISILMGGVCRWHILRFDTGWQIGIPFLPISILLDLTCVVWYNLGLFFPKSVMFRNYYFPKCLKIRDCFFLVYCN